MFDIGFWELVVVAVVALIVVGPEKLPKLARVCGLWLGRANTSLQAIKKDIAKELRAEELQQALKKTQDLSVLDDIIESKQQADAPLETTKDQSEVTPVEKAIQNKQTDDGKR